MDDFISISVEEACGVIRLTRPAAINALTPDMIAEVLDALHDWADEERIGAVLIEGEGERGLCAGGDVRLTRDGVLSGDFGRVHSFFAEEYEMNRLIATYEKPIVAIQHGVVMGGGIGISSHARYRIATPTSIFAMPEAAIGFFCDVGVNALLYKTTQARALAFLLSGQSVGAADAMSLGLTDAMVETRSLQGLRDRIVEAAQANEPDTTITALIQGASADPGPAQFCALADTLEEVFSQPNTEKIIEALRDWGDDGDPASAALYARIARHCPTSLVAITLTHRLARKQRDVRTILETDLAMAKLLALRPDFAEGVRAVLVDKDKAPKWEPARLSDVDIGELERVLGIAEGVPA